MEAGNRTPLVRRAGEPSEYPVPNPSPDQGLADAPPPRHPAPRRPEARAPRGHPPLRPASRAGGAAPQTLRGSEGPPSRRRARVQAGEGRRHGARQAARRGDRGPEPGDGRRAGHARRRHVRDGVGRHGPRRLECRGPARRRHVRGLRHGRRAHRGLRRPADRRPAPRPARAQGHGLARREGPGRLPARKLARRPRRGPAPLDGGPAEGPNRQRLVRPSRPEGARPRGRPAPGPAARRGAREAGRRGAGCHTPARGRDPPRRRARPLCEAAGVREGHDRARREELDAIPTEGTLAASSPTPFDPSPASWNRDVRPGSTLSTGHRPRLAAAEIWPRCGCGSTCWARPR